MSYTPNYPDNRHRKPHFIDSSERRWPNTATLLRCKRSESVNPETGKCYTQSELAYKLGYKGGQYLSNAERSLCPVPYYLIEPMTKVLPATKEEFKEAILKDEVLWIEKSIELSKDKGPQL